MSARALARVAALAALAACTEELTAPGVCPDYCPPGQITVYDTLFRDIIGRDSAFRGYVQAHESGLLPVTSIAGRESRAIFRSFPIPAGFRSGTDTALQPIVGVDSLQLKLTILRRDTAAANLTLHLFTLPLAIDTTTTYADLAAAFAAPPVRSVNVDSLLRSSTRRDTITRDSVIFDASGNVVVFVGLDSAHAPYVPADSGKVALGITVSADSLANVALASLEAGSGPRVTWFVEADSAGVDTLPRTVAPLSSFDTFVFDPPTAALDSTLAIGGVPAARSIVRVDLPRFLRDSTQVLRATLILVPTGPATGTPADSFYVVAQGVETDLGAKSPLAADSLRRGATLVQIGAADTVRVEITGLLQSWQVDTILAPTFMLRMIPEAGALVEYRFEPSRHATLAPSLLVTYARPFPFGVP